MDQLNNLMAQVSVLSDGQRLYRLQSEGVGACVVDRWWGRDALSAHTTTEVDVLSMEQGLVLDDLLGTQVSLLTRTAEGIWWRRSGLIHEARRLCSDGGLVRYRLLLASWTWWLQHARNSRVFQEKTVRQIVDSVLAEHGELARWRWAEGCDAFLGTRSRSYCVQYRESDLSFMQRILAEEGLAWRLYADDQARCGNGMEIFADSIVLPEDDASASVGIRFHRNDSIESSDGIQALGRRHELSSTRVTLLSDDYRQASIVGLQLPMDGGGELSQRESYDAVGAHAFSDSREGYHYARIQAQAREVHRRTWNGQGSVRGLQSGTWLSVQKAPFVQPPELLLVEVEHTGINNIPTDVRSELGEAQGVMSMLGASLACWEQAEKTGYGNAFKATERSLPWRPVLEDETGARLNPRPTAPGYQTALVVAAHDGSGQDVHADALGRIRVRFHFQNGEGHSTWLRVAQRYAGHGVGSQFLPRVGQEVIVGFLHGDIDLPIVLGALYNGRGEGGVAPTPGGAEGTSDRSGYARATDQRTSAQANLSGGHAPAWHAAGGGEDAHRHEGAVWGIRSQEWNGGQGSNHVMFDDSDQQLRVQLASSQQTSQLTLGHLRHQTDNFLGSLRGTGFELRSDAWGAIRATAGGWLTAYGRQQPAPAGEVVQPAALLKQLQTMSNRFSAVARTHQTSPLMMEEGAHGKEVMEMHRDRHQFADRGVNVAAWTRAIKRNEAEVEAARTRGDAELTIGWYEDRVENSRKELRIAQNRRIHSFGLPDELATENGTGDLMIRTRMGGHIISFSGFLVSKEGDPHREMVLAQIRSDIKRMRLRAPGEIPDEPGVCFPGLFFADDGTGDYQAHASFRYVDRPNIAYSIDTGYVPAPEADGGVAFPPVSNWRRVLAYPGVLLTMPADNVIRRDVVRPTGILAGGLSFDKTGIAITRKGKSWREPNLRTYQLYSGMPGIAGVQAMPFVAMTIQSWSQQAYPQLQQQPPPMEESEKRFDAILHNMHLRHTTPEMPDYVRLLGEKTREPVE
ncbi:type VI secretion system tip protein TssI/VgrG [Stenotrophomonas sp. Iso1]|uniref:type VI secretion system tip protein TssI/VgrG n=1 Tax=Stenotrophomonas sp. Iso1 TaxID=2977283 RepID=UPI0022B7D4DC|nr:type VI secretion system tip protein TssI/VgrG [Stenotrophomonas sp. Iso1]